MSEELQLTLLFVASAGERVAVKVSESPSARLMEVLLIDTPLTAMVLSPFSGSQLVSIAEDKTATTIAAATFEIVFFYAIITIYSRMTRLFE